jgi:hypothetical protein
MDAFDASAFPSRQLDFVLYNPTVQARQAALTIPPAKGSKVRFSQDGKSVSDNLRIPAQGIVRLTAEY